MPLTFSGIGPGCWVGIRIEAQSLRERMPMSEGCRCQCFSNSEPSSRATVTSALRELLWSALSKLAKNGKYYTTQNTCSEIAYWGEAKEGESTRIFQPRDSH